MNSGDQAIIIAAIRVLIKMMPAGDIHLEGTFDVDDKKYKLYFEEVKDGKQENS